MNQHITKLVRQALNECVSTPVESVIASRIDDHGIVEIPNTFAEKFAELLVRECYESCKGQVLDKETADTNELTYNDAVGDCAIGLLQHFGMME